MTQLQGRKSVFVTMFVYTVLIKVLPYGLMRAGVHIDPESMAWPWNFSPAVAFFLYGGAVMAHRGKSLLLPPAVYVASDLLILVLSGRLDWAIYPEQAGVYAAILLCAACGWWLRENAHWLRIATCAIFTPVLFFVVTNFAVWAFSSIYPHTPEGLIASYVAAIPHHRNLMLSTLLFSGVLFSPLGVRAAVQGTAPQSVAVQA